MSTDTLKSPKLISEDRRQENRREAPRITIPQGVPLTVEVESPTRVLRSAQCINLSSQGTLLDFGEGKCPRWVKDHKLSVIIQLAGEIATVPGTVRYRTNSQIGMSFNLEVQNQDEGTEQALTTILGILERAVDRRTSSLAKDQEVLQADQPTPVQPPRKHDTLQASYQPVTRGQDRRHHNRRGTPRIPILQGIPLRAEVVTPDRILRTVRCVDLSARGALLDFGTGKCPPLAINAQVLVNLHIGGDIANIPSFVRHRTDNRIGVEFPFDLQTQLNEQSQGLGLILRTLERAVARRRSR